ncbi:hypothetical protein GCM10020360_16530 [Nonlabens tegetincola]
MTGAGPVRFAVWIAVSSNRARQSLRHRDWPLLRGADCAERGLEGSTALALHGCDELRSGRGEVGAQCLAFTHAGAARPAELDEAVSLERGVGAPDCAGRDGDVSVPGEWRFEGCTKGAIFELSNALGEGVALDAEKGSVYVDKGQNVLDTSIALSEAF